MISVAMIVQDEEECIKRAISSIHDFPIVGEIVVLDGGSTDRTKQIAASFDKVKLFEVPFHPTQGDRFDVQRNRSLEACANVWRLVMDADEYYDKHVVESLEMLTDPPSIGLPWNTDCYYFSRRTFIDGHLMNVNNLDWQPRFFKHYCRYNGAIHEGVAGYSFAAFCNLHIMHDKTTAWQQKDNERVWDMGQKPPDGWEKIDGKWQWTG